jgi:uncharacterized SAM-binding protein YcdF (DUF218 family)
VFALKQFSKALILPPTSWFILLIVVLVFWKRRWARILLLVTVILIAALHSSDVGQLLRYPLESRYPALLDPRAAGPYDVIVVLMSSTVPAYGMIPFASLDEYTFRRLDEAWRLYRIDPKPIIVSGRPINPFVPQVNQNQIACDYLIRWGIPQKDVISEPGSRDTFESALEVSKILRGKGWTRYLLVTSAVHMPRSMLAFQAVAPVPIAAPGDFTLGEHYFTTRSMLLSEVAARKTYVTVHEYLGLLNYYWRVRSWQN